MLKKFKENNDRFNSKYPVGAHLLSCSTIYCTRAHHNQLFLFAQILTDLFLFAQILMVPYIEEDDEAQELYTTDEPLFWTTLLDKTSDLYQRMDWLIVDGGHRKWCSEECKLNKMYSNFVRPSISFSEMVLSLRMSCA